MSNEKVFWARLALCLLQLVTVAQPSLLCAAGHFSGTCSHESSIAYRHLDSELHRQQLQDPHKLIETLVEIFKFMYPCASNAEAVLYIFFDPSQSLTAPSEWVNHWNNIFGQRFAVADASLTNLFSGVLNQTSIDCLDNVLRYYVGHGGQVMFHSFHADFSVPPPEVTTTQLPTTLRPDSCVVCSGLECLLHRHSQLCSSHEHYCYIRVVDHAGGRKITRGCADGTFCSQTNPAQCATVESQINANDTTCIFCCQTNDCNQPPALTPVSPP